MITKDVIELLQCPGCMGGELALGSGRRPELVCTSCEAGYPIVDGIPDLMPPARAPEPGQYRAETLFDLIAGVYDLVAPAMSVAIWHCSPLRYIDVEHRAVGRAAAGVLLEAPIATGLLLDKVLAPYHDATIIGVDPSWRMLERARERLRGHGGRVQLIRGDLERLPVRDGVVTSVQSINGIHASPNRTGVLAELLRCAEPGGHVAGTALVRNQERVADFVLDRYERYGIYPLLRTPEFLFKEMRSAGLDDVQFETHGAVLFFAGRRAAEHPAD